MTATQTPSTVLGLPRYLASDEHAGVITAKPQQDSLMSNNELELNDEVLHDYSFRDSIPVYCL